MKLYRKVDSLTRRVFESRIVAESFADERLITMITEALKAPGAEISVKMPSGEYQEFERVL